MILTLLSGLTYERDIECLSNMESLSKKEWYKDLLSKK